MAKNLNEPLICTEYIGYIWDYEEYCYDIEEEDEDKIIETTMIKRSYNFFKNCFCFWN